jgi:hypothetical protein
MGVYRKVRSRSGKLAGMVVSGGRSDGTHVEDMKDPVEVQPPGGDRLFIILRVEKSRDAAFRLPRLTMLLWISATALRLRALVSESPNVRASLVQLT